MGNKKVSVIIVNYNGGKLLTECVRSVIASTVPVEVFVSDNGSSDGSIVFLQNAVGDDDRVVIVNNGCNLGFARGNNVVLPKTTGNFVLFLNPDTVIQPDTIEKMCQYMESDPKVGMSGCLIRNLDGSEQAGCRRSIPTPWRSIVRVSHLDRLFPNHRRFQNFVLTDQPLPDRPVYVEAISGAFMFVRRQALDEVGPLDDRYFMHCEDLDWCMRFRDKGWKIGFVPDVEVIHDKGACSSGRQVFVLWHMHKGMVRFYRKFFRREYPFLLMWLVIMGVWTRFVFLATRALVLGGNNLTPTDKVIRRSPPSKADSTYRAVTARLNEIPVNLRVIVFGATSQIGYFLLPKLVKAGFGVIALSRNVRPDWVNQEIMWVQSDIAQPDNLPPLPRAASIIHLAPLHMLPELVDTLAGLELKRVIAFSSTSRYTKLDSHNLKEQRLVDELVNAEEKIEKMCSSRGIHWTIFRPTLIYGCGMDKNITFIANVIRKYGVFPLVGEGSGLRQPVHADDLADACMSALNNPATFDHAYNLSGGQILSYKEMVQAIFKAMNRTPRFLSIPLPLFRLAIFFASLLPKFKYLTPEMAERIIQDLVFDHTDAARDFGFSPRPFVNIGVAEDTLAETGESLQATH